MPLIVTWVKTLRLEFSLPAFLQAYKWYELGHQRGHFASVWQRSLYNVRGLRAQPWWTPKETGYTELVKVSFAPPRAPLPSPCQFPPRNTFNSEKYRKLNPKFKLRKITKTANFISKVKGCIFKSRQPWAIFLVLKCQGGDRFPFQGFCKKYRRKNLFVSSR